MQVPTRAVVQPVQAWNVWSCHACLLCFCCSFSLRLGSLQSNRDSLYTWIFYWRVSLRIRMLFHSRPETSNGTRGNDTEHATIQHPGLQVQRVSVIQAHSMLAQATGLLGLPRSSNVLHDCRLIFLLNTGPGTRYSPQPGADSVEGDKVRKRHTVQV